MGVQVTLYIYVIPSLKSKTELGRLRGPVVNVHVKLGLNHKTRMALSYSYSIQIHRIGETLLRWAVKKEKKKKKKDPIYL